MFHPPGRLGPGWAAASQVQGELPLWMIDQDTGWKNRVGLLGHDYTSPHLPIHDASNSPPGFTPVEPQYSTSTSTQFPTQNHGTPLTPYHDVPVELFQAHLNGVENGTANFLSADSDLAAENHITTVHPPYRPDNQATDGGNSLHDPDTLCLAF